MSKTVRMKTRVPIRRMVFDEELLRRAVTERGARSKVAMESGNIFLDRFKDEDDPIFITSAAHAEPQRGVTAELLSKVWRISLDEAKQTLEVTNQLNKQDADSGI